MGEGATADDTPVVTSQASADGAGQVLLLSGSWTHATLSSVAATFYKDQKPASSGALVIDLTGVSVLDTAGAWLVRRIMDRQSKAGQSVELKADNAQYRELIEALPETRPAKPAKAAPQSLFQKAFEPLGISMVELWHDTLAAMTILGSAVRGAQLKMGRKSGVSAASIFTHLDRMGVRAVPIILLMSFLIGAIIAQQGAFQLRYFGAEVFVVDLVGILQLREIGVLLTAIMIAGRSGSAITAEIGSMKMREEIDALTVMGLNPVGVLVMPRLIALIIALPLLTIVANFAALFGAAVICLTYSGITFEVFLTRLQLAVDMSTLIAGMLKAPFMALIIGIVSSVEGMKVGGSAESLGQRVTASVVKSIFVVILVDGLFAVFYAAINF